ncbi:hypothetical protein ACIGD1_34920 [Streptomyces sp. NPDC085612]|uniref:hypothetical protein n=1 Tax=Streptomyces sp. NPDC085612 TaxID=3365732 RepID=UPI0037D52327
MSEPVPPTDPSVPPARPEPSPPAEPPVPSAPSGKEPGAGGRRGFPGRFVPRGRSAQWVAAGAAVVVVGGVVTAVAVTHHDHHGRGPHAVRFEAGPGPFGHGPRAAGPGEQRAIPGQRDRSDRPAAPDRPGAPDRADADGGRAERAPAPVPSLPAGEAAEKAAAAVTGGKVVSLRVVGQEGGGSAWRAVVLGPDGVRHAVTVSGTDGSITGNTVTGNTVKGSDTATGG